MMSSQEQYCDNAVSQKEATFFPIKGFPLNKPGGHFLPIRTSFKTTFLQGPPNKSHGNGSARLSARITDFLKRSDQNILNGYRSRSRNYSEREGSVNSLSSFASLSGSTDSLASLAKSEFELNSFEEDEIKTKTPHQNLEHFRGDFGKLHLSVTPPTQEPPKSECVETGLTIDETVGESQALPSSIQNYSSRRTQQDLDSIKKKFNAQGIQFKDKIQQMRKAMDKKTLEAIEARTEQRQVVSKQRKDLQALTEAHSHVKSLLQAETAKSSKLETAIRKAIEEQAKSEIIHWKEKAEIQRKDQEMTEISKQTEFLRTELHRLKLDLHLKEAKLSSIEAEMAEVKELHLSELAQANAAFQSKLKKKEEENELLIEDIHTEQLAKKHLQEEIDQGRRKEKNETLRHQQEMEELKDFTLKKIESLESQLTCIEKEKASLLSSKKELEMKITEFQVPDHSEEVLISVEEFQRLKKELKCRGILLKDATAMAETAQKTDLQNKATIRLLRNSLEQMDAEKSQQSRLRTKAEEELQDTQHQLEDAIRTQTDLQNVNRKLGLTNQKLESSLEETNQELASALNNYRISLEALAAEKSNLADQLEQYKALTVENVTLQERVAHLSSRVIILEEAQKEFQNVTKKTLHLKQGEFKSKVKLEEIKKRRAEDQSEKLHSHLSSAQQDLLRLEVDRKTALQLLKVSEQQAREAVTERNSLRNHLDQMKATNAKLMKQLEISKTETSSLRVELKSSLQRLDEVKQGISTCEDDSDNDDTFPLTDSALIEE